MSDTPTFVQTHQPLPEILALDFPGVRLRFQANMLLLHSDRPLQILSSAMIGGGLIMAHTIVNAHVHKHYQHPDPVQDLESRVRDAGISGPFVGMMTAVFLDGVQSATRYQENITVATIVTAGVGNAIAAGSSPPASLSPGTINLILLVDAKLSPGAMVNAIITATEAKSKVLRDMQIPAMNGEVATGTSTDAVVVACTGRGSSKHYAGPVTTVGWLISQVVGQALGAALS